MQGRNGEVVLGLGGYGTGVAQDTHHLGEGREKRRMFEFGKLRIKALTELRESTFFFFFFTPANIESS